MAPPLPASASLELRDVAFRAPDGHCIVEALSLAVAAGEHLAVIGPNGAGKTTLLRLACGRLKPSAGKVLVGGIDLAAIPLAERARRMAVVSQGDSPDLRLTLADYVGLGRIPHRDQVAPARHRAVVAEALERVGLDALAARRLETLSGGERQRAAIARAVAQEPALLFLDEPTNHLDPRARADMLALARGLGITVVAVLHDLALVAPFADRVAVMQAGRLVAHGEPSAALAPAVMRDVFAMDCFAAVNPANGRPVLVFDTPATRPITMEDRPC